MSDSASPEQSSAIRQQYLEANTHGRDLVFGDLHGCRAVFDRALEALHFDPAADRVLVVGDLIDRGPDSPGCLALLQEPWFHSVMGNHEDMLAQRLADGDQDFSQARQLHLLNGGDWFPGTGRLAGDETFTAAVEAAARLPHVLVVGSGEGRYQLVHAELPPGQRTAVMTDADIDAGLPGVEPQTLVWTRDLMARPAGSDLPERQPGLSPTYCGHTPDPEVRRRLSHVCLDTGAVFGYLGAGYGDLALTVAVRAGNREQALHRFTP
ncbi:metallophosphoesterase [Aquisalimonas lutea]|uniref:metallophosphoesterase n=1 Tax=Aquisalimonas lutea TaxID=1327750 RepID=UPI0025B3A670|nr:metallophosphoesterase [Aquisalimonas lutea]MDN3516172.1 metallophosphoesterase [Aquisalimonas lutea]